MPARRGPKPVVEYDGQSYTCKRYKVEIPDFSTMPRMAVLVWLLRETTPRGYSRAPSPLAGMGGAIQLKVR